MEAKALKERSSALEGTRRRRDNLRGGGDAVHVLRVLLRVLLRHLHSAEEKHKVSGIADRTSIARDCIRHAARQHSNEHEQRRTADIAHNGVNTMGAYRSRGAQPVRVRRRRRHGRGATVGIRQTPQSTP
jgi:hypothetical protein